MSRKSLRRNNSSMTNSGINSYQELFEDNHTSLPKWIFDVELEDEYEGNTSLLEELELDPSQIYKSILWMIVGPLYKLCGRNYERHPLYKNSAVLTNQTIDFWGPCALVSLYGLVLWLGRVKDAPWIYVIWAVGGIFNHLISRVWCHSKLLIHTALLGYSIAPIIPFAAIILFFRPPVGIATLLETISIIWASLSAIFSYSMIFTIASENKSRLKLLFPSIILMEIYFVSLLPIRH